MNRLKLSTFIFLIIINYVYTQNSFLGNWDGKILIPGNELKIIVKFYKLDDKYLGNIDIPQQYAKGLKLSNITNKDNNINFNLEVAPNNIAVFNGTIEDSIIYGNFSQMGVNGTFNLRKIKIENNNEERFSIDKEVIFYNDNIRLCGTLSLPDTINKHPSIILISGSGAQNRDEEIYDFPIFKEISDHFVKNGIAVLRYDDRGIGCSDGSVSNSTLEDFSKDVISAINFLKNYKNIDKSKIGLLGHSEGGIVGSIVASKIPDIKFLILLATPGDSGTTIIKEQTKNIYKIKGLSDTLIADELKNTNNIHKVIITDKGWEELRKEIREKTRLKFEDPKNIQLHSIENKEIFIENLVESQISLYKSKWIKSFLTTNPQTYLKVVKCPVLAIFGEKDLQVDAKINSEKIKSSLLKSKKYKIEILPEANHLFQKAKTGLPDEYYKLEKKFVSGFLELLQIWVNSIISNS